MPKLYLIYALGELTLTATENACTCDEKVSWVGVYTIEAVVQ